MSKYTAKTQAEILRTAPTKDGLVAVSTDTKRFFMSYNGKWIYSDGDENSKNLRDPVPRSQGDEMHKHSDIDGADGVMNLASGSPLAWWKSTEINGLGKPNPGIQKGIQSWKSLISEYSWEANGNAIESYGGGYVFNSFLSTYPTVLPAVTLGGTNSYGILHLNKPFPQPSNVDAANPGATYFLVFRVSDNHSAIMYSPSFFWDYSAGPFRWLSTSFGVDSSFTRTSPDGSTRPHVVMAKYTFGHKDYSGGAHLNVNFNGTSGMDMDANLTSKGEYYSQPMLGRHAENTTWGAKNVYIYEIIMYPSALSAGDISNVEDYLISKYHSDFQFEG